MIDLKQYAFLDIALDGHKLVIGPGVTPIEPAIRTAEAARYSFLHQTAAAPEILYWMYREMGRQDDLKILHQHGLIFDVTIIRPGQVGREFIKTVGHYHSVKPGTDAAFPEVYEVLHGEATFLLQKAGREPGCVEDAVVITAHPGDKVVMPPGYGHITINASSDYLVMTDMVAAANSSIYGDMKDLQGGAYYFITEGSEAWTKNPNYKSVKPLRRLPARNYPEFHLHSDQPMYKLILEKPEAFRFLTHPEEFDFRF